MAALSEQYRAGAITAAIFCRAARSRSRARSPRLHATPPAATTRGMRCSRLASSVFSTSTSTIAACTLAARSRCAASSFGDDSHATDRGVDVIRTGSRCHEKLLLILVQFAKARLEQDVERQADFVHLGNHTAQGCGQHRRLFMQLCVHTPLFISAFARGNRQCRRQSFHFFFNPIKVVDHPLWRSSFSSTPKSSQSCLDVVGIPPCEHQGQNRQREQAPPPPGGGTFAISNRVQVDHGVSPWRWR